MTGPLLVSLVLLAGSPAATPRNKCPAQGEMKKLLGVDGAQWVVACRAVEHGVLQMAALSPSGTPQGVPRLVVLIAWNDRDRTWTELDLEGPEREQIKGIVAEEWRLLVGPAKLAGANWLRVEALARRGEDLVTAQSVVAFFRPASGRLQHLWTGLGDRYETRFDACHLDTPARFSIAADGMLVRQRRATRHFRDPGGIDSGELQRIKEECVAAAPARDSFAVDDDGLNADVTVSAELRARARANRLLFLRAGQSPAALKRFVIDSLSLIPLVNKEASDGAPEDPDAANWSVSTSGAFADVMEGGVKDGLVWKNLISVAGRQGRSLARALESLHGGGWGAWIEQTTDLGGCHRPVQAEPALHRLVDAWSATSPELRDVFKPVLTKELDAMVRDYCFCEEEGNDRSFSKRSKGTRLSWTGSRIPERSSGDAFARCLPARTRVSTARPADA